MIRNRKKRRIISDQAVGHVRSMVWLQEKVVEENLPPRLATGTARVAVTAATIAAAAAATAAVASTTTTAVATGGRSTTTIAATAVAAASGSTTEATAEATATTGTAELAVIGSLSATATAAATTTTTATATAERGLAGNGLKEGRNLLVSLLEELKKLADDTTVATVEESSGNTSVSGTTGTTDTMDVVIDISREIVVDDVGDVGNIQTTSSDSSGDQNRAATVAEHLQSALTLTLSAVTVNGSSGEVLVDQEVGQRISHALGLNENKGETTGVGVENVEKDRALVNILNVLDLLGDVLRGGTNTTNGQEDVVLEEIAGEDLDVAGEGGREHESLALVDLGHVLTLNDTANLGLETHVKHAISLIKDKVLDVAEGDTATLDEIDKTTRSSDKKIAAALDLAKLRADIGTTVDDARTDPRTVGELASLIVDLRDQLTGGSKNESGGVGLALTTISTSGAGGNGRGTSVERLGENGEEETTSLAGTSLGASHQITATHDNGDGVLLDRSGDVVAGELNVGNEVVVQRRVAEGEDGLGHVVTGSLNGNVIVLLEVDTGVLLGRVVGGTEELTLDAGVGRSGNVLAIAPLTIARATVAEVAATGTGTGTSASASVAAVRVGVEAALGTRTAPASALLALKARAGGTTGATGATGSGPVAAAWATSVIGVVTAKR